MGINCRKFSIGWFLSSWTMAILFVMILLTQAGSSFTISIQNSFSFMICSLILRSYTSFFFFYSSSRPSVQFQIEEGDSNDFRQDRTTGTITRILPPNVVPQVDGFPRPCLKFASIFSEMGHIQLKDTVETFLTKLLPKIKHIKPACSVGELLRL